jgi:hypothetical protein
MNDTHHFSIFAGAASTATRSFKYEEFEVVSVWRA